MTGWRIGFLFAPKDITKHMLKVHQYNVSCASSISQKAAYNALTEGFHDGQIMKKNMKNDWSTYTVVSLKWDLRLLNQAEPFIYFLRFNHLDKALLILLWSWLRRLVLRSSRGALFPNLEKGLSASLTLTRQKSWKKLWTGLSILCN